MRGEPGNVSAPAVHLSGVLSKALSTGLDFFFSLFSSYDSFFLLNPAIVKDENTHDSSKGRNLPGGRPVKMIACGEQLCLHVALQALGFVFETLVGFQAFHWRNRKLESSHEGGVEHEDSGPPGSFLGGGRPREKEGGGRAEPGNWPPSCRAQ